MADTLNAREPSQLLPPLDTTVIEDARDQEASHAATADAITLLWGSLNSVLRSLTRFRGGAVGGVAAGYVIARGEHTQVAASDTVVTGLAVVVSVTVTPRTRTLKQLWFEASIGNQAGAPAAGSIFITSKKPTATNDVTPIAATDFTDNIKVNWIAVGT